MQWRGSRELQESARDGGHEAYPLADAASCVVQANPGLGIEGEHGDNRRDKDTLYELADDWRFGGTLIDNTAAPGERSEAYNIMVSMPHRIVPLTVQRAARKTEKNADSDRGKVRLMRHKVSTHP